MRLDLGLMCILIGTVSTMTSDRIALCVVFFGVCIACASRRATSESSHDVVSDSDGVNESSASDATMVDSGMLDGTTWQSEDAVCGDVVADQVAESGLTAYFWGCCFECGLFVDGPGDAWDVTVASSRDSYSMLDPTGECYALRTALYQCLASLTCGEVLAWHEAANDHAEAKCIDEYGALVPRIDECGI